MGGGQVIVLEVRKWLSYFPLVLPDKQAFRIHTLKRND